MLKKSLPSCCTCRLGRLVLDPVIVQLLPGSVGWLCPPVRATGGTCQAKCADGCPPLEQHPKCLSERVTGRSGDWGQATGKGSSNHGQLDDVHLLDDPHLHETDPAKGQGKGWTVSRDCKTDTGDCSILNPQILRFVFKVIFADRWSDCSIQLDRPTSDPSKPRCCCSSNPDSSKHKADKRTSPQCRKHQTIAFQHQANKQTGRAGSPQALLNVDQRKSDCRGKRCVIKKAGAIILDANKQTSPWTIALWR